MEFIDAPDNYLAETVASVAKEAQTILEQLAEFDGCHTADASFLLERMERCRKAFAERGLAPVTAKETA